MPTPCPHCDGTGLRLIDASGGLRHVEDCDCRIARRVQRRLAEARIPPRYEHCTLAEYVVDFASADSSLRGAHLQARRFVDGYPVTTEGKGLLLTGAIGVGKTHLAVGILRELLAERGAHGLFVDYRDLLKQVQNSYNRGVAATELEVLRPVFDAEVLVLDELGASKPTDWVWDTVAHILNTRYNDCRTTIITTNYSNLPPASVEPSGSATSIAAARSAVREETLGDRIGERMRSRLQEMCVIVDMRGGDFRQRIKRASFG